MIAGVPEEQRLRLEAFGELLQQRGVPLGLVAESDASRLEERHVLDCLRAADFVGERETLCDIGPGAGLPGLVIAIARPDLEIMLVEAKERAVGFLELARDRLKLENVRILHARVEEVDITADVATARAFAPLESSWEAAICVLRPGGRLIYFAGGGLEDPQAAAEAITSPERAAGVRVESVIAESSPLVIMTRAS